MNMLGGYLCYDYCFCIVVASVASENSLFLLMCVDYSPTLLLYSILQ